MENQSLKLLQEKLEKETGKLPSDFPPKNKQGVASFKNRYSERIEQIRNRAILDLLHILIHEKIPCKWLGHSTNLKKIHDTHFIEAPFPSISDFFRWQELTKNNKTYSYKGISHVFCLPKDHFIPSDQDQVLILPQNISEIYILSNFLNSYENSNSFKSKIMPELLKIQNFKQSTFQENIKKESQKPNFNSSSRLDDVFGD